MNLEDRQPRMLWYDRRYGTSDGVKFLKFQNFDFQNFPKLRFSKLRSENRYGRSLGSSVRTPRASSARILLIDNTDLPWTVPVHCRSTTWNQLLGGVQPQSDRLTILVAVHKEFDVVPNTIVIEANNTKARKCSTVTETSLDVVWVPTGVGSVRTVLLRFLTIPYLKPKLLFVPDLLVNL